jgi:hypothetical protein
MLSDKTNYQNRKQIGIFEKPTRGFIEEDEDTEVAFDSNGGGHQHSSAIWLRC